MISSETTLRRSVYNTAESVINDRFKGLLEQESLKKLLGDYQVCSYREGHLGTSLMRTFQKDASKDIRRGVKMYFKTAKYPLRDSR